jgi:hypothetical protein
MEERIVVNIPKGYKKVPESNAVYLYKTKETHLSDVKKEGTTRVFKIAFLSRTKSRSISEEISRIKIEYEGAETKYGNYTLASLVKINGFQAVKKEGRIKIESGEYYLTEYTIPSEKNIFVISRYSPTKQSKWAEADFNKIIGSIEIY